MRKKKKGIEIMAAGGRYDQLIKCFSSNISLGNVDESTISACPPTAVGISLAMDKLLSLASESTQNFNAFDVIIYSDSHVTSVLKEKLELSNKLWSLGVKSVVCDIFQTLDEVQEYAQENGCAFIVILRDAADGLVRIRCLEKDRFQEKKQALTDVADFILKNLTPLECMDSYSSRPEMISRSSTEAKQFQVNYGFQFLDRKGNNFLSKKRLESTISSKITSTLHLLAPGPAVEVLALPLSKAILKSMVAYLDFDDEPSFKASVPILLEKHSRHRKELSPICDELQFLRFEKQTSVIILYSSEDHNLIPMLMS